MVSSQESSYLAVVAHQSLRGGVDGVENHEFCNTRASFLLSAHKTIHAQSPVGVHIPAPNMRAVVDSFLMSLADDFVPAATSATLAAASDTEGAIV